MAAALTAACVLLAACGTRRPPAVPPLGILPLLPNAGRTSGAETAGHCRRIVHESTPVTSVSTWRRSRPLSPSWRVWAISSYPFVAFRSGADIPVEYYTPLLARLASSRSSACAAGTGRRSRPWPMGLVPRI